MWDYITLTILCVMLHRTCMQINVSVSHCMHMVIKAHWQLKTKELWF